MRAVQYRTPGKGPELVTLPDPEPGPGQVLLKVTAAGICHSDLTLMDAEPGTLSFGLPVTLGHEATGVVEALGPGTGPGADGGWPAVGDAVAVYGAWGCGACRACAEGRENYCPYAPAQGIHPPGLGAPGALAEYLLVDHTRHLVALGGLDPVRAAPLTDAGLTPYHAIRASRHKLPPGSTAVVIGVGGLGHLAVQILRALTPARIVALDLTGERLALARNAGAHHTLVADDGARAALDELTGGQGPDAVYDLVASPETTALAAAVTAADGYIALLGIGRGSVPVAFGATRPGVTVTAPYWGTRQDLLDVFALAREGRVTTLTETFTLEQAPLAYERLRDGTVLGRAVVVL
ncbi:NAD(P)-dependent alcohol dehydrogenase [Streptomyces clavuligerus]|uniref:alcohol dehydrogenase n=1 Tax=Streptomyces clavuligerus TaxID=1901 RepID=B5GV59_STRCL|nr:NAD(P)-dependent alcohol dehydrogenase [Streptomyces clavuligerus]ANW20129.1 alcohol dehydrogenase [Streptomyces clavuligerus]AXU14755.1 NAD(P)-dependent alcohol dehydrogenase [Streptomyces clavuligerus]EDY50205.1 oxidoreductase [Streptomyces clavuligerus]EFG06964.1 putative alcohol dehydrogenase [Streptomyces clavuligerus]MBY6304782.1 NAD(P)-dependent alcohol dehydrogenase [Streptomyces clavuligerus]